MRAGGGRPCARSGLALSAASAIFTFAAFCSLCAAETPAAPVCPGGELAPANVDEITPGNFLRRGVQALMSAENLGGIANTGFIIGESSVAVIDSGGSYCDGARLRRAIGARTALPIAYVVNTHVHPDHIFGNAAFTGDSAVFVGHKGLASDMAARGEYYLRTFKDIMGDAAFAGTRIILPDQVVDSEITLDLGGRRLIVRAHPPAHTGADLTVYDEKTRTLWAGDLVFLDHIPVLDGKLKGWLAVMDDLAKIPATRVVPGHGPVSPWPDALRPERRYFETLAADLRSYIAKGGSMMEAAGQVATEEAKRWQLYGDYHARNVNKGFAELEWE